MGKRNYSPREKSTKVTKFEDSNKDLALELDYSRGHKTRHNDVSWYSKDPALIRDAASIPFAEPLGPEVSYGPRKRSVPGVAVLSYVPTVGAISATALGQSPINLAAVRYYSEIRKANSGARNYDPNDLIQILLGVAGIYEAISVAKRLYSLLRDYQMTNRYYSKRLIEAMNFDFDDLLTHIADLRYFINVCITRCEVFAIPSGMSFLLRRIWMCESIFLDAPMRKAQTYIFMPVGVQRYNWQNGRVYIDSWKDSSNNEDYATTQSASIGGDGSAKLTFDHIVTTLESMLADMSVNTDVGIITGDLLKAYGEAGVFRMAPIDIDYHIEPMYNQEVLAQIHNATFAIDTESLTSGRNSTSITNFALVQDGALLKYDAPNSNPRVSGVREISVEASPKIGSTNYGNAREDLLLLDMPIDPVSPDQVMVATRLTAVRELVSFTEATGIAVYDLTNFGSEVLLFATLFTLDKEMTYSTHLTNDANTVSDLVKFVTPFSYLPRGFVYAKQSDAPVTGETSWVFDDIEVGTIDNYTIISTVTLFKMHQTAVLSEFNVSSMPASNGRK